ncbi:GNAT family N-acetyltransferase [Luteipulveratus mongoliensis]|uniref:Peptide chain release factor 2 n=1 Tax=Luteipulveratus mongoliensis TaxID=571913 RepID=A0A0K1JHM1_9MICO|nr:GNAT family N-acetyltransferase [Luteipulveratus mongoliensis]AKU16207.1 peptide chain release factor 2 [Luteipulveratus mongoliensis]
MLRPATDADQESVRVWRNHPDVQAVSLTQDEITPEMHEQWWAAVKQDPSRLVLMYERRDQPAGVVNFFDITPEGTSPRSGMWGYYLDNAGLTASGTLLPAWMQIQREGARYAFEELGLDILEGEVLDHNEAVRSMNQRSGFEEIDSYEREVGGKPTLVHRIRRTRDQQKA